MINLTVNISDDRFLKLKKVADSFGWEWEWGRATPSDC